MLQIGCSHVTLFAREARKIGIFFAPYVYVYTT